MKAYVVTHVNQVGPAGIDCFYNVKSLRQIHVGMMFFYAQGIDNERVDTLERRDSLVGESLGIGDVAETVIENVTYNEQLAVHDRYRKNFSRANVEFFHWLDIVYVKCRHAGIGILDKTIRHTVAQVFGHVGLAVYWKLAMIAVWSQVIDTAKMVIVGMGDERSLDLPETVIGEHLVIEIGATVNQ